MKHRPSPALMLEFARIGAGVRHFLPFLAGLGILLLVAWPGVPVFQILLDESPPETFFAIAVALGVALGYVQLQAGAEEYLAAGERSLREWAMLEQLDVGQVVRAYGFGSAIQCFVLIALASPFLLIAQSLLGSSFASLAGVGVLLLVASVFYRLVGACLYLLMGQYGPATYLCVRGAGLLVYLGTMAKLPAASQVAVLRQFAAPWVATLKIEAPLVPGGEAPAVSSTALADGATLWGLNGPALTFTVIYLGGVILLSFALAGLLRRLRARR